MFILVLKIFYNFDLLVRLLSSHETLTISTLTSPTIAITSISTEAPKGNLPAWKQVRAGKFVVNTKKIIK